ncbi:hypothetical protein ACJX0J_040392, partial [Zea mays]
HWGFWPFMGVEGGGKKFAVATKIQRKIYKFDILTFGKTGTQVHGNPIIIVPNHIIVLSTIITRSMPYFLLAHFKKNNVNSNIMSILDNVCLCTWITCLY